jgi:hypothetical protein
LSPDTAGPAGPAGTRDYISRSGAPYGFKPYHLVVGAVIFIVWFSVLGFVLLHGRNEASSVDVYSELPPGFTGALLQKGVTYQGLSPVDPTTQQQALARLPALGADNGGKPLVFRTSYTVAKGSGQPGVAQAALMVVVPDPQGTDVHVDFVDPTTYQQLTSVEYGGTGSSASP